MAHDQKPTSGSSYRSIAPYLTLGLQLAVTIIVFFFIGQYLDEKFGTKPWLMLIMIVSGFLGGMIKFFRTVEELSHHNES